MSVAPKKYRSLNRGRNTTATDKRKKNIEGFTLDCVWNPFIAVTCKGLFGLFDFLRDGQ